MRFLLILLLSGCASVPQNGITIVWHKLDGPGQISEKQIGYSVTKRASGYYRMVQGVCHVWAPDPPMKNREYSQGQWETLGHEIKHCFDGQFHD